MSRLGDWLLSLIEDPEETERVNALAEEREALERHLTACEDSFYLHEGRRMRKEASEALQALPKAANPKGLTL